MSLAEKKPDGTPYRSGTEWELEHALAVNRPVLIYRRSEKVLLDTDDPAFDAKREQKRHVDEFFARFKSSWRASCGAGYVRYVDDMLLFADDKRSAAGGAL